MGCIFVCAESFHPGQSDHSGAQVWLSLRAPFGEVSLQRWYDAPRDFVGCNMFQAGLQQKKLTSRAIDSAWWWLLFSYQPRWVPFKYVQFVIHPETLGGWKSPNLTSSICFRWVETTNQQGWYWNSGKIASETETKRSSKHLKTAVLVSRCLKVNTNLKDLCVAYLQFSCIQWPARCVLTELVGCFKWYMVE